MIRQRYRDEFEQFGVDDLRKRLAAGMYDEDKRKAGREWIDEQENGEDRAYRAEQLRLQQRADRKGTISLIVSMSAAGISALALGLSAWLAIHGLSAGPIGPKAPAQAQSAPAENPNLPK